MKKHIEINEIFTLTDGRTVNTFRRELDDQSPVFECERIRITHLSHSMAPDFKPYTFGAEPEWFNQRGLIAK